MFSLFYFHKLSIKIRLSSKFFFDRVVKLLPGLIMTVAIITLFSNLISYDANVKVALVVGGSSLVSLLVIYIEFCSFTTKGILY